MADEHYSDQCYCDSCIKHRKTAERLKLEQEQRDRDYIRRVWSAPGKEGKS